jgi:signal transduction histidine kinase
VVKKIAEEHGGSIRAENRAQGGAVFTLRLPIDAVQSAGQPVTVG